MRQAYEVTPKDHELLLRRFLDISNQSEVRIRWNWYRRLHALVRREGMRANHKRVYRLYSDAGLSARRRKRRHGVAIERQDLQRPTGPNQVWSMDFVSDALANGRRIKVLTIVDDFSKEAIDLAVDFGISGHYVTRILDQAARFRGYPKATRMQMSRKQLYRPTVRDRGRPRTIRLTRCS